MGINQWFPSGKTNHEFNEEKGNYSCAEIAHGAFSRTIDLPATVKVDEVKATFKEGILEVAMPKREKSQRRTVPIA